MYAHARPARRRIALSHHARSAGSAIVSEGLVPHHAERRSNTELWIYLPVFTAYKINVPETIVVTVPAAAVTSNQSIIASPYFRVQAMAGFAAVSGPFTNSSSEERVRHQRVEFNLTLVNESWVAGVGSSDTAAARTMSETLIRGITPSGRWGAEARGWSQAVLSALLALQPLPLHRADEFTIIFTIPTAPLYDIVAPETLQVHVDESLVLAEAAIVAEPPVIVTATPGSALLSGSLICEYPPPENLLSLLSLVQMPHSPPPPLPPPGEVPNERAAVCNNSERAFNSYGGHDLTISLTNDTYVPNLGAAVGIPLGEIDMLLAGVTASSWLHGRKNLTAQMLDPLLAQGWNQYTRKDMSNHPAVHGRMPCLPSLK